MARTLDLSDAGLMKKFAFFDVDGSGVLGEDEMRAALIEAGCGSPRSQEMVNEMMEASDANGDGAIDLAEVHGDRKPWLACHAYAILHTLLMPRV